MPCPRKYYIQLFDATFTPSNLIQRWIHALASRQVKRLSAIIPLPVMSTSPTKRARCCQPLQQLRYPLMLLAVFESITLDVSRVNCDRLIDLQVIMSRYLLCKVICRSVSILSPLKSTAIWNVHCVSSLQRLGWWRNSRKQKQQRVIVHVPEVGPNTNHVALCLSTMQCHGPKLRYIMLTHFYLK